MVPAPEVPVLDRLRTCLTGGVGSGLLSGVLRTLLLCSFAGGATFGAVTVLMAFLSVGVVLAGDRLGRRFCGGFSGGFGTAAALACAAAVPVPVPAPAARQACPSTGP